MNETMGAIISELRKERGLTQEQLANQLGISYQAVSKWENEVSSPDIAMLPLLADFFQISIDRLFDREALTAPETQSKETLTENVAESAASGVKLPWEDDDTLHVVLFVGHELVGHDSARDRLFSKRQVEFQYKGPALNVQSDFDVSLEGEVQGNVTAGGDVRCDKVYGSVQAGGDVRCDVVYGNVTAGGDVSCEEVQANVSAGHDVSCDEVQGDVNAQNDVNCGHVEGNVTAGGDISCGSVEGGVNAGGSVQSREDFHSNLKGKKKGFSFELKL